MAAHNGEPMYDVVVVGGGAAGLNAALVLSRARRRVAVVDDRGPRNAPAAHMHGFLSRDGIPPAELLATGGAEVAGYGGELIEDRVVGVEPGFAVQLAGGRILTTRRLLVTTGLHDELPDIPGVGEQWGKDVVHCPYCHGHEVADQPVGIIATQTGSIHQALLLGQWSRNVVYFPHTSPVSDAEREQLTARDVQIVEGKVNRLVVEGGHLRGVELAGGSVVPRTAVFLRPRFVPHDELLTKLGCEKDGTGATITDAAGRTSVFGVWAAGNVVDPHAQVVTAAGQGSAAAIALNNDLLNDDVERAIADHRKGE